MSGVFEVGNIGKILLITLAFALFLGVYLLLFLFSYRIRKETYVKIVRGVLLGAIGFAFVAALAYLVIVQPKLQVVEKEAILPPKLTDIVMETAASDSEIAFPSSYLKESWEITTDELNIQVEWQDKETQLIVVDQSLAAGESGKVSLYERPIMVNGVVHPDEVTLSRIFMNDDELFVYPSGNEQTVNYQTYEAPILVQQFKEKGEGGRTEVIDIEHTEQVLYIQVAPEVTVTANEGANIYYRD